MFQFNWERKEIKNWIDINQMLVTAKNLQPDYAGYDTEATGLNIMRDKPFVISFGFVSLEEKKGYSYVFDIEKNVSLTGTFVHTMYAIAKECKYFVGHNLPFDLHMLLNIGYEYPYDNVADSLLTIRLAHDAVPTDRGGVQLGLKSYAYKYIDRNAKTHEKKLKEEAKLMKSKNNKHLLEMLRDEPIPDELRVTGKERRWTMGIINNWFKDMLNEIDTLPNDRLKEIFTQWRNDTKNPNNYKNYDRENVKEYAHFDIIYTLEIFARTYEIMILKKNEVTFERECKLIKALVEVERTGFNFDTKYVLESKELVRNYIIELRQRLNDLAGEPITCNQHAKIKEVLATKWNYNLESVGREALKELDPYAPTKVIANEPESYDTIITTLDGVKYFAKYPRDKNGDYLGGGSGYAFDPNTICEVEYKEVLPTNPDAIKEFIDTIVELRTLEKWYSTYILGWLEKEIDGRVYTTFNQAGTVSGRVSGNFQQFPSKPIVDREGNELFHPRRMFINSEDFRTFYLDYAAMELRILAIYTILISGRTTGDLNLCRAFIPLECHTERNGKRIEFDFNNKSHVKNFKKYTWYKNEDNKEWVDTDLHWATASSAFDIPYENPKQKYERGLGKRANFLITYGGSPGALTGALKVDLTIAKKLYDGYFKAFPKVKDYGNYVRKSLGQNGYIENLLGRKYYGTNPHNGKNLLIQGTGGDYTKEKLIAVVEFLKPYKSRAQMYIHDEISFEIHKDEEHLVPILREIMEEWSDTPIILDVDVEVTDRAWSDKYDWK